MRIRWLRGESGGAMVEFALVVPLLLALVMGVIEFGRAWNIHQVVTDAAREGARRAVVNDGGTKVGTATDPGSVPAVVLNRLALAGLPTNGSWDPANHTASCTGWSHPTQAVSVPTIYGCGWGATPGTDARVAISAPYPFNFLRPVLQLLGGGGGPVLIRTNFVMRNE